VVFPVLEIDLEDDRCAQIRDVIPAETLGSGAYLYEVRVLREGNTLDETARGFRVASWQQPQSDSAGSDLPQP
jgi:hypothetical protein